MDTRIIIWEWFKWFFRFFLPLEDSPSRQRHEQRKSKPFTHISQQKIVQKNTFYIKFLDAFFLHFLGHYIFINNILPYILISYVRLSHLKHVFISFGLIAQGHILISYANMYFWLCSNSLEKGGLHFASRPTPSSPLGLHCTSRPTPSSPIGHYYASKPTQSFLSSLHCASRPTPSFPLGLNYTPQNQLQVLC